ncbi:glycosyltransferase family 32 protein [Fibrobacter sp. UWS1]|uniref:glycosyltransferase family 32 protein n=1 Tax=Fibrobacter sp. UWS1 TaxID=1896220 RepID=UPI000BB0DE9F|nr:glycosyltransferase [Fibrobacter sp. UWS1]PBC67172.1 glycosyl transferase-like sugar-binding protein [Fibrobacter sp. UWS1]
MIPKIIHYCWFSNDPLPKEAQRCIDSWKKYLPDYQIRKWTLKDFDVESVAFTKEALEQRKWAYLTDYVRHYALYNYGGLYMDSDVLVLKNLNSLMTGDFVSAVEYHPGKEQIPVIKQRIDKNGKRTTDEIRVPGIGVQAAILAAIPHHELNRDCMDFYHNCSLQEVLAKKYTAPIVISHIAEKLGFVYLNKKQNLDKNVVLFPAKVFANYNQVAKDSYAVHCCAGSWVKKNFKQRIVDCLRMNKLVGKLFSFLFVKKPDDLY